jgi:UPF0755 protein
MLRRNFYISMAIIVSLLLAGLAYALIYVHSVVVKNPHGLVYHLKTGASYKTVATDLYTADVIKHPNIFANYLYVSRKHHQLKAGEYFFALGSTPASMVEQITTGKGIVYHAFTIVPGTTFAQLRALLNANPLLKHTTAYMSDSQIMAKLGAPIYPEGEFFPDTYFFVRDSADSLLLSRAFKAMQAKLANLWQARNVTIPFQTPYQALIAASLIEKETNLAQERPIIAAVLINRLRQNMLLQFDPTVIYGLGVNYTGKIYKRELIQNTPYNTYVNKGLPPTPIAMPSIDSLQAVMRPATNDYLYFVAKAAGGGHQFSKTLAEHNAAVLTAIEQRKLLSK